MPVAVSYPGVYIEEIPSGVRTIAGVATSVTAFLGRAQRGPVDAPVLVNGYGDFERVFGGLWTDSALGYAVRDFFLNGGGQAIIVRLFHPSPAPKAGKGNSAPPGTPGRAQLSVGDLNLEAAYEGAWGNALRVRVDQDVKPGDDTLFNLAVRDDGTGRIEYFRNVSVATAHPRRLDNVLANESSLARAVGSLPPGRPAAHANPGPGEQVWGDNATATNTKATAGSGSDGDGLTADDFIGQGKEGGKGGLFALEKADIFNLLVIPPYTGTSDVDTGVVTAAAAYCEKRRALLLVDAPSAWTDKDKAKAGLAAGVGTTSKNAALYFPRLQQPNPLRDNQVETFAASGAIAGVFARTDAQRGVWKAPAGLEATLAGVAKLSVPLTDAENGELNPLGINCLRAMPAAGPLVWGARTLQGDDRLASEWKYVPVRRLALFIEESLFRGTQWVVFEPNDEPLWSQIRLNVGAFLHSLFVQGAFQGTTPFQAYFVRCDRTSTTQEDIDRGIVNIVVGFAPLKPAEFVVIQIQQIAGQSAS
jgi:uncharacterized protein